MPNSHRPIRLISTADLGPVGRCELAKRQQPRRRTNGRVEGRQRISVNAGEHSATLDSGSRQPPRVWKGRFVWIDRVVGRVGIEDQSEDSVTRGYPHLYTVTPATQCRNDRIPTDMLWRVFRILTQPVPYTFVCVVIDGIMKPGPTRCNLGARFIILSIYGYKRIPEPRLR